MKSRQRRSHIIPELTLSNHIINKLLSTETGECSQGSTQRAANGVPFGGYGLSGYNMTSLIMDPRG
jgi:hypothetical protein